MMGRTTIMLLLATGLLLQVATIFIRGRSDFGAMLTLNTPLFLQVAIGALALPLTVFAVVFLKQRLVTSRDSK